jgi:ribose 5-phosphate isomerase B
MTLFQAERVSMYKVQNIVIGSDHAGFQYKERIKAFLGSRGVEVRDLGTDSEESTDYPLFVRPVAEAVARGEFPAGIVLGGSGNGEAIVANKVRGIRCAVCWSAETARLAKEHNDANMIAIGQRTISEQTALDVVDAWLSAAFLGGRHARRVNEIAQREQQETPHLWGIQYLANVRVRLLRLKDLADGALAQVQEQEIFATLGPEDNSIAILVKHLAGNMRSRWSNLFLSDGEHERDRDREFEIEDRDTRAVLLEQWEAGWQVLLKALASFSAGDLEKTVLIRGRSYSLMQAISRQLPHYAYHVGQIVFLAKHWRAGEWRSLSIPRGQSQEYER